MGKFRCDSCRQVAIGNLAPSLCESCGVEGAYTDVDSVSHSKTSRSANASDYVPENFNRIETIEHNLNVMLWGGFVYPSTTMLWGKAGGGKSRTLIRLAPHMGKTLYVTNEMPKEMVIKFAHDFQTEVKNLDVLDDEQYWESEAALLKPKILVYDSVSESNFKKTILLPKLANWAKKSDGIVICVAHRNKKGQVSGSTYLEHWPDYNLDFRPHGDDQVQIKCPKSRFCPKGQCFIYLK
jgi:predicted ATP-dependent serine protease